MKRILTLFFLFSLIGIGNSQSQQIKLVTPLQDSIKETSGLIYLNEKIITHNDSGGEPVLYELDSTSGHVTRKVVVSNASNIDWEDLCYDDTYIYIADIGNNNGSRRDLRVYRIRISEYFLSANDTVSADTINFTYMDQTDFTASPFATNFDAEAIISWNDSLYVFTKNWRNIRSNIYALPKDPGSHQIIKVDSINSQGLVTGATFNSLSNSIMLSGYTVISPFIIEIRDYTNHKFSNGTIDRKLLQQPAGYSFQIEGITSINQNQYYLSSEGGISGISALYRLNTDIGLDIESIEESTFVIYPNPTSDVMYISNANLSVVEIYDLQGALLKTSKEKEIDVSDLSSGVFIVIAKQASRETYSISKLIIE